MKKLRLPIGGRELGLLACVLVLATGVFLRNSEFLTGANLHDMIKQSSFLWILAIGMMLVLIIQGIDLSIAANMAFSGMVAALLVRDFPAIPPLVILCIGVVVGGIAGFINGVLIAKGGLLPIIATLGMMYVLRGVTFLISGGRWVSAYQFTEEFQQLAKGDLFGISNLIFVAVLIYLVGYVFIQHTATGRRIYAVGNNPNAAKMSGISKEKITLLVYTLMGVLSGLAGVLWVARFSSAQSNTAMGYEMQIIAACVVGGVSMSGGSGRLFGVFLGALLMGLLHNALPLLNISPFWQDGLQGGIILFTVIMNVIIQRRMDRSLKIGGKV